MDTINRRTREELEALLKFLVESEREEVELVMHERRGAEDWGSFVERAAID